MYFSRRNISSATVHSPLILPMECGSASSCRSESASHPSAIIMAFTASANLARYVYRLHYQWVSDAVKLIIQGATKAHRGKQIHN